MTNRMASTLACSLLAALLLAFSWAAAFPTSASAQSAWPPGCAESELDGQLILICFPPNWNGVLLLYAHGYVAPQEPLALPQEELNQARLPDGRSIIEELMEVGFAFATTSYSKNGYAVQQADGDLRALLAQFKAQHGQPKKTLLTGASEGGLITVMMIEKYPQIFSGGLAMCGPVGGAPYQLQYVGDFRVVFDAFFPSVFDFGVVDVPEGAWQDWESLYAPAVEHAIRSRPLKTWQLFSVTEAAWIPWKPETAVETAHTLLRYSVVGTNDLIELAGGMPYNNMDTRYRGSFNDWRLNRIVERVDGDPAYLFDWYQTTGALQRPVVTLHTLLDGAVPFQHENLYLAMVRSQERESMLTVLPVLRYGHCNFKAEEVLGAFALLFIQSGLPLDARMAPYLQSLPQPQTEPGASGP
jgi:hypothetical protein